MKKYFATIVVIVFSISLLSWKLIEQERFRDEILDFVSYGITEIQVCDADCNKVVNCEAVSDKNDFDKIVSIISGNKSEMVPGHSIIETEKVVKLYKSNDLLCFRAVEYKEVKTSTYLQSIVTGVDCSTYKFGRNSVVVVGLGKYLR